MGCGNSKDVINQTKHVAVNGRKNNWRQEQVDENKHQKQQPIQVQNVEKRQKQNGVQQDDDQVVNHIIMHQEIGEPEKQQETKWNQNKGLLVRQLTQEIEPVEDYHQQRDRTTQQKVEHQEHDQQTKLEDENQQHDKQTQLEDENQQHGKQTQLDDENQQHGKQTQLDDENQQHGKQTQLDDENQQHGKQTQLDDENQQHGKQTQVQDENHETVKIQKEHKIQTEKLSENPDGKYNKQETEDIYEQIDKHARQAPDAVKNSTEDIVNYLSSVSKDPLMLLRGIFVWISENIKYDVDGYFGRVKRAPCDSQGVLNCGRSVCEGYANVMSELCSKASIPAKKISGFAKGYSHSADQIITESSKTNHAWNAVQLKGVWYLIDSTWGAGHLNSMNQFEKEFNECYFLTNPKHFITDHFPYMDGNMEESMKWQLLDQPVSLLEYSRAVKYSPGAFRIGARAVSHTNALIEMNNELKMAFKSDIPEGIAVSTSLTLHDGNTLREQNNATYGYMENGVYVLFVHPPKVGTYTLDVFGRFVTEATSYGHLMTYIIKCTEVNVKDFEYPGTYGTTDEEKVILRKPLTRKLQVNKKIDFQIEAPYLQTMRVGKTYLEKSGNVFTGSVTAETPGELVVFANSGGRYDRLHGIFNFVVVK